MTMAYEMFFTETEMLTIFTVIDRFLRNAALYGYYQKDEELLAECEKLLQKLIDRLEE